MKTALITLVTILVIIALATSPLNPLWRTPMTAPIQHLFTQVTRPAISFIGWFVDVPKLAKQRDQLAAERNQLLAQVNQLHGVQRQNDALRQELNQDKQKFPHLTIVQTAGTITDGPTTYLLLTKGTADNLQKGQIVISNGVLVGKIQQTTRSTSLVQLPQSLGSTIPAIIHYPDGAVTKGIIQGSFNLSANLDQVLPTEKLLPGAVMTTSSDGNLYPPDIVIGKVGQITSTPNQPFQSATVDFLWNIESLEYVAVIK